MAEMLALVYAEGNEKPDHAIEILRESQTCSKIFVCGYELDRIADEFPAGVEIWRHNMAWEQVANQIAMKASPKSFLLLVSALAEFTESTILELAGFLERNPEFAGVNPVFTTYDDHSISHLGTVADSLGFLHYLYAGIAADSFLARKERQFQLAHPGFLLMRCGDLQKKGGFADRELGFIGFCRDICLVRSGGFAVIPQARVAYENYEPELRTLGILNSLNMRGKIAPGTFITDYAAKVKADDLEYGVTDWLQETPQGIQICEAGKALANFLNDMRPETMLAWLAGMEPRQASEYLNLIREYPYYLPSQFRWYEVIAAKKLAYAEQARLERMASQIRAWQKKARSFHYGKLRKGMALLNSAGVYNRSLDRCPAVYDTWLELAPEAQPARVEIGRNWPRISVVMPVYNPDHSFFLQAVQSVRSQTYSDWELCMADDASSDAEIRPMLEAIAKEDSRIKVAYRTENGHISRATNSALEMVEAPWTAFMDNDDLLAPDALAQVAETANSHPGAKLIFSDLDHIDADNVRRNPVFRPEHDFDHNFVAHLACYKTELLRQLGGLRAGFEGSQDLDLSLRAIEKLSPAEIRHIPRILYHWRVHQGSTAGSIEAKPYIREAAMKARYEYLKARRLKGEVGRYAHKDIYWIRLSDDGIATWAIAIIGNQSGRDVFQNELIAKLAGTGRINCYFIPGEPEIPQLKGYCLPDSVKTLPFLGSGMKGIMRSAALIEEEVTLFISDSLNQYETCDPEQLLIIAQRKDISAVGSLIFVNGILYSGGCYPDADGGLFTLLQGSPANSLVNYCWGLFAVPHPAISPSPLCFAMRRETIRDLAASDLDGPFALAEFCLQESAKGRKVLISPWGQWQLDTAPRQMKATEAEKRRFSEKWGDIIKRSGLRNPNLRAAPDMDWTLILPD